MHKRICNKKNRGFHFKFTVKQNVANILLESEEQIKQLINFCVAIFTFSLNYISKGIPTLSTAISSSNVQLIFFLFRSKSIR